jgi:uncharacterized short protein YbdD (DUF466 family)
MAKGIGLAKYVKHVRHKRPGIHAKTKESKNKHSKNYVKPYNGQGK